jgi:hypothetical protein
VRGVPFLPEGSVSQIAGFLDIWLGTLIAALLEEHR